MQQQTQIPVIHQTSFIRCLLVGTSIALVLMSAFLFNVKHIDPAWGKYWMIRPFVVIAFAGACGGAVYYFMDGLRSRGGWRKITANALCLLIYIIGLWMGTVLGLDGTLWD